MNRRHNLHASGGRHSRVDRVRVAGSALGGLATGVLIGGRVGPAVGVLIAVALWRLLPRIESRSARRQRIRALADLPYAADLLAAALRAGLPLDRATPLVGTAIGGPVGSRLCRVARSLSLGLTPGEAWSAVADLPGGPRMAAAAVRSADSGAALSAAFGRLADDLRAARASAAETAARSAGVLIVLPLGLCFLPAFVFAGIVPVIVAVLGDVLPR